jgi:hypothetical protein
MKVVKMGLAAAAMLAVGLLTPLQAGAAKPPANYEQTFAVSTTGGAPFSYGITATWSWAATATAVLSMKDLSCVGKHSTFYVITSISCVATPGPRGSFIVTETMTQKSPEVCIAHTICTPHFSQTLTDVRQVYAPDLVVIISQTV